LLAFAFATIVKTLVVLPSHHPNPRLASPSHSFIEQPSLSAHVVLCERRVYHQIRLICVPGKHMSQPFGERISQTRGSAKTPRIVSTFILTTPLTLTGAG